MASRVDHGTHRAIGMDREHGWLMVADGGWDLGVRQIGRSPHAIDGLDLPDLLPGFYLAPRCPEADDHHRLKNQMFKAKKLTKLRKLCHKLFTKSQALNQSR